MKKSILISIITMLLLGLTVGVVLAGNKSKKGKGGGQPIITPTESVGVDVARYQGDIDWNKVPKDNILFVYVKATEGKTYIDPTFHRSMKGAKKAGFKVGAYHFFRMTSGAREQFEHFQSQVGKYKMDLIPMIDVETSDGKPVKQLQDSLDVFISLVKKNYGVMPMIYGTQRSYNTYCAPKYNNLHLYIGARQASPDIDCSPLKDYLI